MAIKHATTRLVFSATIFYVALIACDNERSNPSSAMTDIETGSRTGLSTPQVKTLISANDSRYTVDDFIAVGFKSVTQFDLDTLPAAIDAWYGFHAQKDIELRFYESHADALEYGIEPAEVAVGKAAVGYSRRPPRRWDAYAVVGNVVMLCELEIATCENLISEISR